MPAPYPMSVSIRAPFSAQPNPSLPQLRPAAFKALNQLHPSVCWTWQAGLSHCRET